MSKISAQAKRLRVYIGESDRYQHIAMFDVIVKKAKELDLAGASVFRGIEGFGAHSRIHTARIVDLSTDLPILIEIIDSKEYIDKLLPFLDEVMAEAKGMITIDDVEVIKYGEKPPVS
jgi:PII-like signaling protein